MVVVFGSINVDLVARAARIPAPGGTLTGSSFRIAPGGKGANQALAARRAGAAVAMFGAVGRDAFAAQSLVNLTEAGIDLAGVRAVDVATGVAMVTVADDGENAIIVIPGANALASSDDVPDHLLSPDNTLLMQLEVPLAEITSLASRAHARGARVVLNAAPAGLLPSALLHNLDVLIVNETEASALAVSLSLPASPEVFATALMARYGTSGVVTLGARGAITNIDGRTRQFVPPDVDVVDTTGAGDALAGALAAAFDRGEPIGAALRDGVAAGALACTRHGAQTGLPDAASVKAAARRVRFAI